MNPFRSPAILREAHVFMILLSNSVIYAAFCTLTASTTQLFSAVYRLSNLQIGLCFIASGGGAMIRSMTRGVLMDRDYRIERKKWQSKAKRTLKAGDDGKYDDNDLSTFNVELARMRSLPAICFAYIGALTAYGWLLNTKSTSQHR